MDAMILAAGLGTRLRPLTNTLPKALVPVGGVPMLDRVARRLAAAGVDRIVVNVSWLAGQVAAHVEAAGWRTPDGRPVEGAVSEEPEPPLETGGGIKRAAPFFRRDDVFLVHNADLLTTVDLAALADRQRQADALATLAVAPAHTDRYLLVDDGGLLGYAYGGSEHTTREADGPIRRVDFCGVHACAPALLDVLADVEDDTFSVMTTYLRLSATPGRVAVFEGAEPHRFLDVGTTERLAQADAAVAAGDFA